MLHFHFLLHRYFHLILSIDELIKPVGKGAYGEVSLYRHKATSQYYVIKKAPLKPSTGDFAAEQLVEIEVLSKINSEFIVKHFDHFKDDTSGYVALEFCDGGDLATEIKQRQTTGQPFTEEVCTPSFNRITIFFPHSSNAVMF
jgi:serine/threonine protein kinase